MSLPDVTDHAVLRYLERGECRAQPVPGKPGLVTLDIASVRQHIAKLVQRAVARGGDAVIIEGVKFVLHGNRVTTVLDRRWQNDRRNGDGAR